jgi:hypothetical protein
MDRERIAQILYFHSGKLVFRRLDFLQQSHVRIGLAQPVEHEADPRADGIDVPGGDFHCVRSMIRRAA